MKRFRPRRILTHLVPLHEMTMVPPHPHLILTHLDRPSKSTQDDNGANSALPLPHLPRPHPPPQSLHTQRRQLLALVTGPRVVVPPHSTATAPRHHLVPPYATTTTAPRPRPCFVLTHLVPPHRMTMAPHPRLALTHLVRPSMWECGGGDDDGVTTASRPHPPRLPPHTRRRQLLALASSLHMRRR
jgi:hypothetical protein